MYIYHTIQRLFCQENWRKFVTIVSGVAAGRKVWYNFDIANNMEDPHENTLCYRLGRHAADQ